MDPFAAIILGIVAFVLIAVVALGIFYPGSGAAQVGWRTPREHADAEAALDSEDLEQMLEAANSRRRARGERELTVEGLTGELDEPSGGEEDVEAALARFRAERASRRGDSA